MKIFNLKSVAAMTTFLCIVGVTAAQANSNKAEDFIKKASMGNLFEIESSKIALKRSQNADVKQFAQQMIDDHSNVSSDLETTVQNAGKNKVLIKKTLDDKHQKIIDKLQKVASKDFDKEYVDEQNDAHKDAVKLFKDYSESGDDNTLKDFATKNLPTLEDHQHKIKAMKDAM